jgi:hypothetical protein
MFVDHCENGRCNNNWITEGGLINKIKKILKLTLSFDLQGRRIDCVELRFMNGWSYEAVSQKAARLGLRGGGMCVVSG